MLEPWCCHAADITTILSGSILGTVGSNGQVLSMQERINSIAPSVFEDGTESDEEEEDNEETAETV